MSLELERLADADAGWRLLETVDPSELLAEAEHRLAQLPSGGLEPLPVVMGRDDPELEAVRAELWT